MGTNNSQTKDLQSQFKKLLEEMHLSQKKFFEKFICDKDLHSDDEKKEFEAFKKRLQRPTTKSSYIQEYIDFIYTLPEYKLIKLKYIDINDEFSQKLKDEMKNISKYIDELIEHGTNE
jgi:hypothetical protein